MLVRWSKAKCWIGEMRLWPIGAVLAGIAATAGAKSLIKVSVATKGAALVVGHGTIDAVPRMGSWPERYVGHAPGRPHGHIEKIGEESDWRHSLSDIGKDKLLKDLPMEAAKKAVESLPSNDGHQRREPGVVTLKPRSAHDVWSQFDLNKLAAESLHRSR